MKMKHGKDRRSDWKRRAETSTAANVTLIDHNRALAAYAKECELALKGILATAAGALEGMLLIITPGQRDAAAALERICKVAAPFAADLPREELEDMLPARVMARLRGFLNPDLIDKAKGDDNASGSEEAAGEVQAGGSGDEPDRQD